MIIRVLASCALLATAAGPGLAAEPDASSTDDALLRKLLGESEQLLPESKETDATDPAVQGQPASQSSGVDPKAVERIVASLRAAEEGLAAKRTDDETQSAQMKAIDELERLIETAKKQRSRSPNDSSTENQAPQPMGSPSPSEATSSSATAGASSAAGQPQANRPEKAQESSDRLPDARDPNDVIRDFRFEIVRDAWGHLPPRLRDQILNARSDRYLPEYDSPVRRYFEALAQPQQRTAPRP